MTVNEYVLYKKGKFNGTKFKDVISFWDTNPTEKQEELRSRMIKKLLYLSCITFTFCGIIIGFGLRGLIFGN